MIIYLFKTYVLLFKHIAKINWISIVISIIAIALIVLVRAYINERYKKQMRNIPVPTELIIVPAITRNNIELKK